MSEKTIINPKLLELIDSIFDNVDDQKCALTYAACIELDTLDTLYNWGVFKDVSDEHKFRVALMERDIEGDTLQAKYKLRFPLFVNEVEEDMWDEFYKWLVKNPKLTVHKGRFSNTQDGRDAFKELQLIKDFDISRFKASVETYYNREGQYAKALPKFLIENAKGEYEGFREIKSKLI